MRRILEYIPEGPEVPESIEGSSGNPVWTAARLDELLITGVNILIQEPGREEPYFFMFHGHTWSVDKGFNVNHVGRGDESEGVAPELLRIISDTVAELR